MVFRNVSIPFYKQIVCSDYNTTAYIDNSGWQFGSKLNEKED